MVWWVAFVLGADHFKFFLEVEWQSWRIKKRQCDQMALALSRELRDATREDALADYEVLCTTDPPTEASFRRTGLRMLDYFFLHHRIKARTRRHISFFEAMQDPEMVDHLDTLVQRYKKRAPSSYEHDDLQKARYSVFQLYYGTINQFRPVNAQWIYRLFEAKGVLDFSAGWGGRCLAAMSMGIPYVGVDANRNLEPAYRAMIRAAAPTARTTMLFQPSETVDFSKFEYDLIFTSPPYFMIEEYERMPQYGSKEGFLTKFFLPVVKAAWQHLARGGHMVLNMPEEMKEALVAAKFLPRMSRKLAMPLANRHPTNAAQGAELGTTNTARQEWIYVWRKP